MADVTDKPFSPLKTNSLTGPGSLVGRIFYWTGKYFFYSLFRIFWRLKIDGLKNIPAEGPVIFAANHRSLSDPPLLGCCVPRIIHFMAKQELFHVPILGWAIRQVNAFPIRRAEKDMAAFNNALNILGSGGALILFPEGTRQRDGEFGRAKPGVGLIASKTGARVVPVYLHNTPHLKSFHRLRVRFGAALAIAPGEEYQTFSNRLMDSIRKLSSDT